MATTYKATWIWYPGDYEIWLGNKMNNRRTDRGAYFPPFWKQDSHYVTVEFSKAVDLTEDEELKIEAEGSYNIKIDGKMLSACPKNYFGCRKAPHKHQGAQPMHPAGTLC